MNQLLIASFRCKIPGKSY